MYIEIANECFLLYRWSSKRSVYVANTVDNVLKYLRYRCEVQPTLTLGGLLSVIKGSKEARDFFSFYSHCDHTAFNKFMLEVAKQSDPSPEAAGMYFGWASEVRDSEMSLFSTFYGMTKDGNKFGFINTPIQKITHLPVFLSKEVQLIQDEFDITDSWYATRQYTLMDVLSPLFWEIGFFGKDYVNEYVKRLNDD